MYRYSFQKYDGKTMARAVGRSLDISLKHAIEISNFLRGRKLGDAQRLLEMVIKKKIAVPFKRFTEGAGHKPSIGPGKYPVKASKRILKLLREVEANATAKGIMEPTIIHISAKKASTPLHHGRHPGRAMKRTHVEVVVSGFVEEKIEKPRELKEESEKKEKTQGLEEKLKKEEKKVEKKKGSSKKEKSEKKESRKKEDVNASGSKAGSSNKSKSKNENTVKK